jgi:hypothetical protein
MGSPTIWRTEKMTTGFSLLLIALGAVLAFAVNYTVSGIEIQTIGAILMVVGIIGLLFSLLFMASFAPFGRRDRLDRYDDTRSHDHL